MAYGVNAPFGLRPFYGSTAGTMTQQTRPYYIYANSLGNVTQPASIFTGDPVVMCGVGNYGGTITQLGIQTLTAGSFSSPFTLAYGQTYSNTLYPSPIVGVFQGCQYTDTTGKLVSSPFWPGGTAVRAGTQIQAFVIDDPTAVFDIQLSSPTPIWQNACFPNVGGGGTGAKSAIGSNIGLDLVSSGSAWVSPTAGASWATQLNPGPSLSFAATGTYYYSSNASGNFGNPTTGNSYFYASGGTMSTTSTGSDYNKTNVILPLKIVGITPNPQNLALYQSGISGSSFNSTIPFLNVLVTFNNHAYKAGTTPVTVN